MANDVLPSLLNWVPLLAVSGMLVFSTYLVVKLALRISRALAADHGR